MRNLARTFVRNSTRQATRYESAVTSTVFDVEIAPNTPCPRVACSSMDEARQVAKDHGFDGLLLC